MAPDGVEHGPNGAGLAAVALPVPLAEPLTYRIPPALSPLVRPGVRVRVPIGRRRATGVVIALLDEAPAGITLRDVEAVVDFEPILPPELLELAAFVSRYYLAPIGEVVRAILPNELPAWGDRKVWITAQGAFASTSEESDAAVLEVLRGGERVSLAELARRLGGRSPAVAVERLAGRGWVATGSVGRRGGARYRTAVELVPGTREELLARAGRSVPGRAAVEHLATLGRPASLEELERDAGVSAAVVRRLLSLEILRSFTQVEKLDLGRHRLDTGIAQPIALRPDQQGALDELAAAIAARNACPFLLQGVTGSGKTEVYLRAAQLALEQGGTVLLLVPEIALVPALAQEARLRFGETLALLHSALAGHERQQEWERIRSGEARVVLGPRSAVFAPLEKLGLIVVDEEQDPAYKQETTPRYHGRDLALLRGQREGCPVLLVSATPSLETRFNAGSGRFTFLRLTERAGQGELPAGILVDLRQEGLVRRPGEAPISRRLEEEIAAALEARDQVILLRNRRGYAPLLLCRACGEDFRCEECGLPRTWHRREGLLLCHYCGARSAAPARCPSCSEGALEPMGAGTERVEETVRELFPGVAVDVLDRDALRRPGGLTAVLERFSRGDVQILVGTQMVSKGHHFPRVALTAVLAADTYLGFPDFRAVERTYTLLTQLAGRAGRGDRPGRVVIQTYHPEHYAIRAALAHDDEAFAREEMRFRRAFAYPPFTRMVQVLSKSRDREKALRVLEELDHRIERLPRARGVRRAGPAPAPLERLKGEWRFQLLLRHPSGQTLRELVRAALPQNVPCDLVVDIDPHHLL